MLSNKPSLIRRITEPANRFLGIEAASGILLLAATVASLLLVNSPIAEQFLGVLDTKIGVNFGSVVLEESVRQWINEGLMTIFFFVVGLEIKRELTDGELANRRAATLPVIAAFGGMVVPAAIYAVFNTGNASSGWAIPMATDIAFTLGLVALAGTRVPPAAKIFLLSLAIADDIGSVAIVALFYTNELAPIWLAAGLATLGLVVYLRASDVRSIFVYVVLGASIWLCALEGGLPPTLVGVVMGLLAPARHHHADGAGATVTERIQTTLHPWSSFVILPLFALANAGIAVSVDAITAAATSPVTIGIVLARTIGKAVGIAGAVWIAVRLNIASLPTGSNWKHIGGIAAAAGTGFTVSLFVTDLAFGTGPIAQEAKIGLLAGTVISGVSGLWLLMRNPIAESEKSTQPKDDQVIDLEVRLGQTETNRQLPVP